MFNNNLKAPCAAFIAFACFTGPCFAQAPAPEATAKPTRRATIDDFYSRLNIVDSAISLSGQYLAAILASG